VSDVADNVRRAADHIERTGLHKGESSDWTQVANGARWGTEVVEKGIPCCALGAVWAYNADLTPVGIDEFFLQRATGYASIPSWNDAPERTAEEVVAFLREFADSLETQAP
jgi:hypothetical protein